MANAKQEAEDVRRIDSIENSNPQLPLRGRKAAGEDDDPPGPLSVVGRPLL